MKKDKLFYLQKALEVAKQDRDLILKTHNEYYFKFDIGKDNSKKMRRYEQLREQGYDPMIFPDNLVEVDIAIEDLETLIYHEKRLTTPN